LLEKKRSVLAGGGRWRAQPTGLLFLRPPPWHLLHPPPPPASSYTGRSSFILLRRGKPAPAPPPPPSVAGRAAPLQRRPLSLLTHGGERSNGAARVEACAQGSDNGLWTRKDAGMRATWSEGAMSGGWERAQEEIASDSARQTYRAESRRLRAG
jgi:hypothetical protein